LVKDFEKVENEVKSTDTRRRYNPFLYPFSIHGIINMLIIVLLLVVWRFVSGFLSQFTMVVFLFRSVYMIGVACVGYFFMYLSECMLDSGDGGTVAPDTIPGSSELEPLIEELTWGIIPLILCFMPAILVNAFFEEYNLLALIVLLVGLCLFPIFCIRSMMMRSFVAFNPIGAAWNIIRYLPDYLLLLFAMAVIFAPLIGFISFFEPKGFAYPLVLAWFIYGCVVFWHLMGRFYFKHRALLDWE